MNNPDPQPISQQSHLKIAPAHQQRWACIYVRQSTVRQVRYNQESQVNQYHLVQRAEALGFIAHGCIRFVIVVDDMV